VQELILRRVVTKPGVALSILCLDLHRGQATEEARQQKASWEGHCTASSLGNAEHWKGGGRSSSQVSGAHP
jgi:hypothetical protein